MTYCRHIDHIYLFNTELLKIFGENQVFWSMWLMMLSPWRYLEVPKVTVRLPKLTLIMGGLGHE